MTAANLFKDPRSGREVTSPLVVSHKNCSDGFAAAFGAWTYFEGEGEYLFMTHDETVPDVTGRDVYMLDIAFDVAQMERISAQAASLTLLDHHESAANDLRHFQCRCGYVLFDLSKSAARLAWEYFHAGTPVPALIAHVEDRDLLQWMLDESEAYLASLDVGPHNFYRWAGIMKMPAQAYTRFMERGRAMRDQARKVAQELAADAVPVVLSGQHGLMVSAPDKMHNDVGALLVARSATFALMWCLEKGQSRVKVGLRAAPGFDAIPLAKAFGGGGHAYAAAFRLPVERLSELLKGSLDPA